MSDTTERARELTDLAQWLRSWAARESAGRGALRRIELFGRWADTVDALAAELAAAEKRNEELERRLAVLDSPHLFDAIRAITNLSQNDVELAIRAVRLAMDMAQAGHEAGVAALAAASEGKP